MLRTPAPLAKLTRPKLLDAVPRERLFNTMDERLARNALWVTGPPGAGKTTAVAGYIEARRPAALWYQLDRSDADVTTFFYYLRLAVHALTGSDPASLPALTPELLPDLSGFARHFFRTLGEILPCPGLLVFDNYHEAENATTLHEVMNCALSELPDGIGCIVVSRLEPPAEFARALANQSIGTIGWSDLRLTETEALAIAGRRSIRASDLARLAHQRSGGWVAGLILVLSQLESMAEDSALPRNAPQVVFNYFASTFFDKLPAQSKSTLLGLAFITSITPAIAIEISEDPQAEAVLRDLHERNFFVDRHLSGDTAYRLHDLFREFLQDRVRQLRSTEEVLRLMERSAEAMSSHGYVDEAILLYCNAACWDSAAAHIQRTAPQTLRQGRWEALLGQIEALPADCVADAPWLLYWRGLAQAATDMVGAQRSFVHAFEGFRRRDDRLGQMLSAASGVDAAGLMSADLAPLRRWVPELEALLLQSPTLPSATIECHVLSSLFFGRQILDPDHPRLSEHTNRLLAIFETSADELDPNLSLGATVNLMQYYCWRGDFERAGRIRGLMLGLLENPAAAPLRKVFLYVGLSLFDYMTARHDDCEQGFCRALEIIGGYELPHIEAMVRMSQCWYLLDRGELKTVSSNLQRVERLINPNYKFGVTHFHHVKAWLASLQGDLAMARQEEEASIRLTEEIGTIWTLCFSLPAMAECLIEQGEYQLAKTYIARFRSYSPADCPLHEFHSMLLEAYAAERQGDDAACLDRLARAFAIGLKHQFVTTMRWNRAMMSRLARFALEHDVEVEYARYLIRRRGLSPDRPIGSWPWKIRIYTLGRFQVQRDGEPVEFSNKVPKKPVALLKAIVASGGNPVYEGKLLEALWPDEEGDAGHDALAVALHRLRKLLGDNAAVVLHDSRISLNRDMCWVDAWAFEQLLDAGSTYPAAQAEKATEDALRLYRGSFLPSDLEETWSLSLRERLRSKFIRRVAAVGRAAEDSKAYETAVARYTRGLEEDDLAEEFYQGLMRCHLALGNRAEGLSIYGRLRKVLGKALGISPSPTSEALHEALLARDS
jgi:ATP/maltotriose-dependent transcriptional regulator MalT/DNA-binding SARP family transcriptional activator